MFLFLFLFVSRTDWKHSTEEELVSVSKAAPEDVDRAVSAAKEAFFNGTWQSLDGTQRGKLLLKLADLVEAEHETIAALEALDTGKTFSKALKDIHEVFEVFRYYGGWADKHYGQTIDAGKHRFAYTIREPIGVTGSITPYVLRCFSFFRFVRVIRELILLSFFFSCR